MVSGPPDEGGAPEADGQVEILTPVEPWSSRYFRMSATDWVEILLVRMKSGNRWRVINPDASMGLVTIIAKNTVFGDPAPGIRWNGRRMPLLTSAQKSSYEAQAVAAMRAGTVPDLPSHRPSGARQHAVAANLLYVMLTSWRSGMTTGGGPYKARVGSRAWRPSSSSCARRWCFPAS